MLRRRTGHRSPCSGADTEIFYWTQSISSQNYYYSCVACYIIYNYLILFFKLKYTPLFLSFLNLLSVIKCIISLCSHVLAHYYTLCTCHKPPKLLLFTCAKAKLLFYCKLSHYFSLLWKPNYYYICNYHLNY